MRRDERWKFIAKFIGVWEGKRERERDTQPSLINNGASQGPWQQIPLFTRLPFPMSRGPACGGQPLGQGLPPCYSPQSHQLYPVLLIEFHPGNPKRHTHTMRPLNLSPRRLRVSGYIYIVCIYIYCEILQSISIYIL